MNSFWHSLQRIAHGQLFAHGYLAPRTAVELANRPEAPQPRDCGGGGTRAKAIRWPRLAIPH